MDSCLIQCVSQRTLEPNEARLVGGEARGAFLAEDGDGDYGNDDDDDDEEEGPAAEVITYDESSGDCK